MRRIGAVWGFLQAALIENVCRYGLLLIILLAFVEVVRRYLFGDTFMWYQDVAVYGNLALMFLYFGVALRNDAHIRLTLLLEVMRRKSERHRRTADGIEAVAFLVSAVICIVFIVAGFQFVAVGIDFGRRTDSAGLLLWPFYALLVFGFFSMTVESLIAAYKHARAFRRSN